MENNGKGTSIFYGVIGVATLVITIIGATFAYFSATTNSDEDAVAAAGATLKLAFSDDDKGYKDNLIPIDVTLPEFNTGGFVGDTADKCQDINDNNICSVYEFTVTNPSDSPAAQRVYGTIKASVNTFTNFNIAVFKGTVTDVNNNTRTHKVTKKVVADEATNINTFTQIKLSDAQKIEGYEDVAVDATVQVDEKVGWDVDGTAITEYTTDYNKEADPNKTYTTSEADAIRKHVIANKGDLVLSATTAAKDAVVTVPAWEQVLDKGESMTYTIVMWIPETDSEQNADQGKSFAAGVYFTTEGSGTGVTGVLSTTSK